MVVGYVSSTCAELAFNKRTCRLFNTAVMENSQHKLLVVKLVHATLFILMSGCVVYTLYSGIARNYHWTLFLAIGVIVVDGMVLMLNKWQCPLTSLAKKLGDDTGRVTDIFFPAWFVPHVLRSYSALFTVAVLVLAIRYLTG